MRLKLREILTAFLILIAPLFNYLVYLKYDIFSLEVGLIFFVALLFSFLLFFFIPPKSKIFLCVAYSIILILFIDFQFDIINWWGKRIVVIFLILFSMLWAIRKNATVILLTVFATINLVTMILYIGMLTTNLTSKKVESPVASDLPTFIHIILDEYIGIEGIPANIPGGTELRLKLKSFYNKYGFSVYGAAYSEYFKTKNSISTMLNLDASLAPERLYEESETKYNETEGFVLKTNAYFQKMINKGYRIKVYQSSYLDFCQTELILSGDCTTYHYDSVVRETLNSLNTIQKFRLIFRMFALPSFFANEIRKLLEHLSLNRNTSDLSTTKWDGWVSPLAATPSFEKLVADVRSDPDGILYFAHFLLPHHPYIYDRNCKIRTPVSEWKNRRMQPQNEHSSELLYLLYFEQIECTMLKMEKLFESLKSADKFENASIILHGDHGSRITINDPYLKNNKVLVAQDLTDAYSTLFAVKVPKQEVGYNRQMYSITKLFQMVILGSTLPEIGAGKHKVFLDDNDGNWDSKILPDFSDQDD